MRGGQVDIPAHTTPAPLPLVAAIRSKKTQENYASSVIY